MNKCEYKEIAGGIKLELDRPDMDDAWFNIEKGYLFDPASVVSASDLS
jgi:hypothetical protein